MKLGDLKGNPQNPRKISQKQLELLKNGLDRFGDISGIVYNLRTNRLVCGHQRVKCLPPSTDIIKTDDQHGYFDHNNERFIVRFVDWDDDTERIANILANKAGGMFDNALLSEWLLDLDSKNFNVEDAGFTEEEFENLCAPKENSEKTSKTCPHCGKEL